MRLKRTLFCNEVTSASIGQEVILSGWVNRIRNHGGVLFLDLRDRYGLVQIVFDGSSDESLAEQAAGASIESVVSVKGIVRARPEDSVNTTMETGAVEVVAKELEILSKSAPLPFPVEEGTVQAPAKEELRLKYRYLDLRRREMKDAMIFRHNVVRTVRNYLSDIGFLEIETPFLIRSTPEGARDYVVPSRLYPGEFYALPQSPQLYKQMLMVAGFDKYFQIARCFRDEDSRADRQPEHTQIDLEMSFVTQDDVLSVTEGMLAEIFKKTMGQELEIPLPRLSYDEAMLYYGTDKPDIRFDMKIHDISELVKESGFKVFRETVLDGNNVRGLAIPGGSSWSRKKIDELAAVASRKGAKGLAWAKVTNDGGWAGGISKFIEATLQHRIADELGADPGDLVVFVADTPSTAAIALGAVRTEIGEKLNLTDSSDFKFLWVTDFPLFDKDTESGKWIPFHHPFSMPREDSIPLLDKDPSAVRGLLYDLVLNGVELASGSIRIHDPMIQKKVFEIIDISDEEAERRFGFLLEAFRFGVPPHGGIAPGLDRLVMVLSGRESIREVIAFPKTLTALSLVDDAPSTLSTEQLGELHLSVVEPKAFTTPE